MSFIVTNYNNNRRLNSQQLEMDRLKLYHELIYYDAHEVMNLGKYSSFQCGNDNTILMVQVLYTSHSQFIKNQILVSYWDM
jgi:hypothetical protein